MVFNPFCCTPIRVGAKRIAVIDIVLFFITIVVSVGLEWSLFNSVPMRLVLFDDGVTSAENYEEPPNTDDNWSDRKAVWIHVAHAIKSTSEFNKTLGYLMYMSILIAMTIYFILEIWLCCVLIRATTEKRPEFLPKWLVLRIILLIFTLAMTGINLAQHQYTVTDIVIQPLNLVRIYSIFAVIQLRKKLLKMDPKLFS